MLLQKPPLHRNATLSRFHLQMRRCITLLLHMHLVSIHAARHSAMLTCGKRIGLNVQPGWCLLMDTAAERLLDFSSESTPSAVDPDCFPWLHSSSHTSLISFPPFLWPLNSSSSSFPAFLHSSPRGSPPLFHLQLQ